MVSKNTNLYLNEELVKAVKKIAIDENTSVSQIVTELLEEYLRQKQNQKKP